MKMIFRIFILNEFCLRKIYTSKSVVTICQNPRFSTNLTTLVTGAAIGLGKETATYLSRKGCSVIICDLPKSRGQEVADTLEKAIFTPCDVSSENDVMKTLNICKEKFGNIDIVVNCAGKSAAFPIANPRRETYLEDDAFNDVIMSNLYGTFNVTRLVAQMMTKNKPILPNGQKGVIINVGATYADDGVKCQSIIAAAKAGISSMTLPLARELSSFGIRVVTIAPGLFETPILSEETISLNTRLYLVEQMQFPKRFGHPEEFAKLVEDIINNPMINGEVIKLSGGFRAHGEYSFVDPDFDVSTLPPPRTILKNLKYASKDS